MAFFDMIKINGKEFIRPKRLEQAIKIMSKMKRKRKNKKIIISGSFLFNDKHGDIDVFIFSKYDKEDYRKGKIHVTFLPESAIDSLFFSSLSKISVSNLHFNNKKDFDLEINAVLQTYELLINAILNNEDNEKILRDFILQTEYISKGVILNPKQLSHIKEKLSGNKINILSIIFINSLILSYDEAIA